jgi:hypothetical protein
LTVGRLVIWPDLPTPRRRLRRRGLRWGPIFRQPDLPLQDRTIQSVSLASDPVLRLAIDQGQQPHDDQRAVRYVQVPPFGRGHDRLPHLEAVTGHGAYVGLRHVDCERVALTARIKQSGVSRGDRRPDRPDRSAAPR